MSLVCKAVWSNLGLLTEVAIWRFQCVFRFYANYSEWGAAMLAVMLVVKYDLFGVYCSVGV